MKTKPMALEALKATVKQLALWMDTGDVYMLSDLDHSALRHGREAITAIEADITQSVDELMTNNEPDEPAFPRNYNADGHNGMSLRDYFAAKAMQAIFTRGPDYHGDLAKIAYQMADDMLEARK